MEKEEKKSDMTVLVPKEKEVVIGGEVYVVKPFKVKDLVFFSREIQAAIVAIKEKNPNLKFKESEMAAIIPLLMQEAERLIGLLARAVGKEKIWLEEQADIVGFSALFQAVTEVNDFGAIISNFMLGWGHLKNQKLPTSAKA